MSIGWIDYTMAGEHPAGYLQLELGDPTRRNPECCALD